MAYSGGNLTASGLGFDEWRCFYSILERTPFLHNQEQSQRPSDICKINVGAMEIAEGHSKWRTLVSGSILSTLISGLIMVGRLGP